MRIAQKEVSRNSSEGRGGDHSPLLLFLLFPCFQSSSYTLLSERLQQTIYLLRFYKMKEYKKFVRAFFLWPPLGVNGSAICNAKNSNNSSQYGGNFHKKLDTIINSSRKQQVYNRKSLTYHYIEIIIFCGHWCTCYLVIQHPPCTTHINHRSVTYWTSIPPKTKKWLTRSRGEKIGFTKT